ncbi:MAG: rhodanese-like domain-containing protein [Treponema sp.]|nr:rhodanese-like domain-containing protein [Treponema sp.]
MAEDFIAKCRSPGGERHFAVSRDGLLHSRREEGWELFDFNRLYKNYYPPCVFTALENYGGVFYLAAMDHGGMPFLFSSLMGDVWEMINLTARGPLNGRTRASGKILRILHDPSRRQLFLVCANGQLVTLPDCPKCLRIRQAADIEVRDGKIEGDQIRLFLADGSKKSIAIEDAAQYRVSLSFVREKILPRGILADLRSAEEFTADHLEQSVNVPMDRLSSWLAAQGKNTPLVFLCRSGVLSDTAVLLARSLGFIHVYSLGGILGWAHKK